MSIETLLFIIIICAISFFIQLGIITMMHKEEAKKIDERYELAKEEILKGRSG